ncbi:MAG: hypothetical protein ACJ706_11420 [Nitrososphaeraceae archaeon]
MVTLERIEKESALAMLIVVENIVTSKADIITAKVGIKARENFLICI